MKKIEITYLQNIQNLDFPKLAIYLFICVFQNISNQLCKFYKNRLINLTD